MILEIYNHQTFVKEATSEEIASLKKICKVYIPLFNSPQPYKTINLYNYKTDSFSSGYLTEVTKKLEKNEIAYKLKDKRIKPSTSQKIKHFPLEHEILKGHQITPIELVKTEPVGVISSATGTGKSKVIEEIIYQKQARTLVITPTINVQRQMVNRFYKVFGKAYVTSIAPKAEKTLNQEKVSNLSDIYDTETPVKIKKLGGDYGDQTEAPVKKLGSSYFDDQENNLSPEEKYLKNKGFKKEQNVWKKPNIKKPEFKKRVLKTREHAITVLCFQSLPEVSEEFLKSIECVIIDECHHSAAETIREALDSMSNAYYRYGLSATAWRDKSHEQKLLVSALGSKIIFDYDGSQAIEDGVIAKPILQIITPAAPDEFLRKLKHWRTIVEKGIIGNRTRNESIVSKAEDLVRNNHNVFICVDEIAHLDILKKRLADKKIEVLVIHGQQNEKINEENIKKMGEAEGGIIAIGTMAVGEGTDMPNISAVILAGYGKSSIRFLQRIGRGTRKVKNKDKVIVIDFEDWFNPILLRHSIERQKIFKEYFK